MSYRVHVREDFITDALTIFVMDNERRLLLANGTWSEPVIQGTVVDAAVAAVQVPRDAASPLLAALARTLGAVEHPEQLRRDFEHERGRVDRLIDHLMRERL